MIHAETTHSVIVTDFLEAFELFEDAFDSLCKQDAMFRRVMERCAGVRRQSNLGLNPTSKERRFSWGDDADHVDTDDDHSMSRSAASGSFSPTMRRSSTMGSSLREVMVAKRQTSYGSTKKQGSSMATRSSSPSTLPVSDWADAVSPRSSASWSALRARLPSVRASVNGASVNETRGSTVLGAEASTCNAAGAESGRLSEPSNAHGPRLAQMIWLDDLMQEQVDAPTHAACATPVPRCGPVREAGRHEVRVRPVEAGLRDKVDVSLVDEQRDQNSIVARAAHLRHHLPSPRSHSPASARSIDDLPVPERREKSLSARGEATQRVDGFDAWF